METGNGDGGFTGGIIIFLKILKSSHFCSYKFLELPLYPTQLFHSFPYSSYSSSSSLSLPFWIVWWTPNVLLWRAIPFLNAFTSSVFGLSLQNQIPLRYLTHRGKTLSIGLGFIKRCRRKIAIWTLHEWKCQVDIVNMPYWLSVENGIKFTPSPLNLDPRHDFRLFFSQFIHMASRTHCWPHWALSGSDFLSPEVCSPKLLIALHVCFMLPSLLSSTKNVFSFPVVTLFNSSKGQT